MDNACEFDKLNEVLQKNFESSNPGEVVQVRLSNQKIMVIYLLSFQGLEERQIVYFSYFSN